jgi:hypothetical protein
MRSLRLLLVFTLMLCGLSTLAQTRTVTGKVTDSNGGPVVGATVSAPGTSLSTQTGSDGTFSLNVPNSVQRLEITSVGYTSQSVTISGTNPVAVSLVASASQLSEVVVTALGIQKNRR